MAEQTAQYDHIGSKDHIPPDVVVDGAPQRVRTAHALISR
jgi:hypothetical protein